MILNAWHGEIYHPHKSIQLVKTHINSRDEGLPRRFNDVGERCFKGKYNKYKGK